MYKIINYIILCLLLGIVSCQNKKEQSFFNFNGDIKEIKITNKGYDGGQKLKKKVDISDKNEILKILNSLKNTKIPEDDMIGSNNGYIRAIFINELGEEFIFENFYSVHNGIIILYQGSNRYKNDAFASLIYEQLYDDVKIEDIVGKEGRELIERATYDMDTIKD